ncbi:hypothetical protein OROMI_008461 [Orobanche minor]
MEGGSLFDLAMMSGGGGGGWSGDDIGLAVAAAAASGMSSPRFKSRHPDSPTATCGKFFETLTSSHLYKNTKVGDISGTFRWAPFLALQKANPFLTMLLLLSKYKMKSVPVVDLGEAKIDNVITQSAVIHMLGECAGLHWFESWGSKKLFELGLPLMKSTHIIKLDLFHLQTRFSTQVGCIWVMLPQVTYEWKRMDICCLCGNAWISACSKKPRGRTKMLKVHGRSPTEKSVITLSKNGQPIGDRKVRSELSNFLGTLVKHHVSLTHVNWHVVPQDLKRKILKYTLYDIPAHGGKYINMILNSLWRVHKSRVKKDHNTKYDSDEKRIENRPHDIPLEDFKILLKYWADEGVQSLVEENAARRNSYADPHTLGRKTLVEIKEKLFLKKLGEANPTLKFDIGDFCATFSSDQDEPGTPITQTPGGATS